MEAKAAISELKRKFMTNAEALLHGDLHTGGWVMQGVWGPLSCLDRAAARRPAHGWMGCAGCVWGPVESLAWPGLRHAPLPSLPSLPLMGCSARTPVGSRSWSPGGLVLGFWTPSNHSPPFPSLLLTPRCLQAPSW